MCIIIIKRNWFLGMDFKGEMTRFRLCIYMKGKLLNQVGALVSQTKEVQVISAILDRAALVNV